MSAASDFAENLALKFLLTNTTATRPTAWYVALYTTATSDAGGGTEVSGGSYARQAIAFTVTTDTATNSSTITFPTASASWGSIGWVAIYDASTGGNSLFHGAVTTAKTIDSGDTFQISSSNLSITLA
jgi:hypothetical protein